MTVSVTVSVTEQRLGIVDWGIGGVGLLLRLQQLAPRLDVTYWSDAGVAPYGKLASPVLAARLHVVVDELAKRGCTHVALACNAASTVVSRLATAALPTTGIIAHGIACVPTSMRGVVGVVGGRRTINAGVYRRGLARPDRTVISRVAQPLSAHIEAGRIDSSEFRLDLARIVAPLRGAQGLLLACTHYPAAMAQFAEALPGTLLLDPAAGFADALVAALGTAGSGATDVLTTGSPTQMRVASRAAWKLDLGRVRKVATTR